MKIKEGFMLRTIAGSHVVVPLGEASTVLNGIISLNETGEFLWNLLAEGTDMDRLTGTLAAEYGISKEKAAKDTAAFLDTLRRIGCLDE